MEEKLPELSISCPVCNDREHKMTIFYEIVDNQGENYYIKCDKCSAMFKLNRCRIFLDHILQFDKP